MSYAIPPEILARNGQIFPHTINGTPVFVKKRRRGKNPVGKFFQNILYRLTGNVLILPPLQPVDGSANHEAAVLRALALCNINVPTVLHAEDGYFVMSAVGDTLEHILTTEPGKREYYIMKAADALGRFHEAGHVHGGAQIKNITVQNERIFFIDFEERIPPDMIEEFQLRDLFLFILSLERKGWVSDLPALVEAYSPRAKSETLAKLADQVKEMWPVRLFDLPGLRWMKAGDIRAIGRLLTKTRQAKDT